MNKLAVTTRPPRAGRALIWPGRALYIGPLLENSTHAHHALQISIALRGELRLQRTPRSRWYPFDAALTMPDQPHRLACDDALAQVYLDPESRAALRLAHQLRAVGTQAFVPPNLATIRRQLRDCWREGWDNERCDALLDEITGAAADPVAPATAPDPRIAQALTLLASAPRRQMPLPALAAQIGLSPSRVAHLFRAETGLPLRRYLLWLRLIEAVRALSSGHTLTQAAHEAGFADAAHMSRTFRRMFGMPPSALAGVSLELG